MAARLAEALAALLLEHHDLGAARLSVNDAHHPGVRDKGRTGKHLAAVLLEKQHLVESDFLADFRFHAVNRDHGAGIDPDLTTAGLNDCEHVRAPPGAWGCRPFQLTLAHA